MFYGMCKENGCQAENSNLQTEVGNLNLIFNVNNLLIPSAGKYVVTLEIGELVKESTLYVVTVKQ